MMELSVASALITFLLTIALIQAIILISKRNKRTSSCYFNKLPPGPKPLPFLGHLLELGDKPHKSLANLAKIHGPLMTLKLGQITTIVISSANLAKQVLLTLDPSFCNRNVVEAIQAREHHQVSVVWLPVGAPWRNLRKICNSYIFSNQKLDSNQELRRKKIQDLVDQVEASCRLGVAVDIGELAFKASLNVLSTSVFSLDLSDSKSDIVREFKEVVRCVMDEVGKPNLADYFPILRKIDPQRRKQRVDIQFGVLFEIFDRIIDKRLLLRKQPGYIPANDVLDTLLSLSEDDNSEGLDLNCIKHLFFDLFVAGTDTTSSTLEWALAELLRNPNTLIKAQAEIEQTIGKGKLIQESDIAKLPYLQAVIKETFRLHPAAPFLLPRKAGEDVEIGGFIVPKDAQVLVNAWAIGRDPSLWEDADLFIPERFLGSDIDARGRNFELIPFGAGRRICPGLPLAIRMLHLMLGSLINLFGWKLEDENNPNVMNMEDRFGITLQKAHPLLAVPLKLQH
uniref:Cytochrome P450 n=1 Tax=Croton stellatopilosus TaxID=431156 RepID=A0A3G2CJZ5_9ROSI|nr:cytochrome P450 [Croton stellatopilosus]